MASLILGLCAAISWGVADFLARYTSRDVGAYRSLFFMQAFGFGMLCAFWLAERSPQAPRAAPGAWGWAALAGVLSAAGSLALYRAFATGKLAVVAPISAAYPVLTALLAMVSGDRVKETSWAGIALVFAGVSLTVGFAGLVGARCSVPLPLESEGVSGAGESIASAPAPQGKVGAVPNPEGSGRDPRPVLGPASQPAGAGTAPLQTAASGSSLRPASESARTGVGWALFAAACFGVMFWLLGLRVVPALGGFTAAWMLRLVGAVGLGAVAWPARRNLRLPPPNILGILAAIGALDTGAYLSNNFGMTYGHVAVVAVLTSLYAAVTVLLAAAILRERLNAKQWLGVLLIFAGVVLLAA